MKFDRIVIHHTVSGISLSAVKALQQKQVYHYLVFKSPSGVWNVIPSLPDYKKTRNAVGGLNTGSLSVAFVGNFNSDIPPSSDFLIKTIRGFVDKYSVDLVVTHNYAGQRLVANKYYTECPGANLKRALASVAERLSPYCRLFV